MCFLCAGASLHACNLEANNNASKDQYQNVIVSFNDLIFEDNTLSLAVNGELYAVRALEQQAGNWVAKIDMVNYCPEGHPLCSRCSCCHVQKTPPCRYYVPPCWWRK